MGRRSGAGAAGRAAGWDIGWGAGLGQWQAKAERGLNLQGDREHYLEREEGCEEKREKVPQWTSA